MKDCESRGCASTGFWAEATCEERMSFFSPSFGYCTVRIQEEITKSCFSPSELEMGLSPPCISFQFLQFPGKGHVNNFWRIYSYTQRLNSAPQHTSTVTKKMSGHLVKMHWAARTVAWQQPKEGLHIFQALPSLLTPATGLQWEATLLKEPKKSLCCQSSSRTQNCSHISLDELPWAEETHNDVSEHRICVESQNSLCWRGS